MLDNANKAGVFKCSCISYGDLSYFGYSKNPLVFILDRTYSFPSFLELTYELEP